jgi:multiple sugar transport system substrate-binding protein
MPATPFTSAARRDSIARGLVRAMLLLFGAAACTGVQAQAVAVSIACRCVEGGVNGSEARWLKQYVIPEYVAAAKAQGREVTVKLREFAGSAEQMSQQLALDFATGQGADLAEFDGFQIPGFVDAGLLRPLAEVAGPEADAWEGWSHIPDSAQELVRFRGKRYGLPEQTDVRMIFYRRDLFRAAGLDADRWRPRSWDDILAAARALKRADPKHYPVQINAGVAMGEATTMQGYLMLLAGAGEELRDAQGRWIVQSPGMLAVLDFYKTVYRDEALGEARTQRLVSGRNRSFTDFQRGNSAILVESNWFYYTAIDPQGDFPIADRDGLIGWAKMPARAPGGAVRGQDFISVSGGNSFVLNPNSKQPREAWSLLAFMNSAPALRRYQEYNEHLCVRDDVLPPKSQFLRDSGRELLPLTTIRPIDADYEKVSAEIQRMTESVIAGKLSPHAAMAEYAAAVKQIVGADRTVVLAAPPGSSP